MPKLEGQVDILLSQLSFRFGQLPKQVEDKIKSLTQEQLSRLTLAVFDFKSQQELVDWLEQNAPVATPETGSN
jgi:Domain of unknown function (DUF4351)